MQTLKNYDVTHAYELASYWDASCDLGFPTAMWRLPNQNTNYLLTSFTEVPNQLKIDLEELPQGFAVAPYENPNGDKTYFLPADVLISFNESSGVTVLNSPKEIDLNWRSIQEKLKVSLPKKTFGRVVAENNDYEEEKKRFIASVASAVNSIKSGELQKVVLSRKKTFSVAEIDLNSIFERLCVAYPSAFVSVVLMPHLNEIWIGASPEILVSQNAKGHFKTMALAGTQSAYTPDNNPIKEADAAWRQKEIEEQALVSRYIINCFKKVRVREFNEIGPRSVRAGNLIHLQTIFGVDTQAINFPQLTSVMLDLLHPTSAVCGMPKEKATQFIKEEEKYNREFYSGYLGPVNIKNETNLFVNLRTMKFQNGKATLFAGCGITADSHPEKEWLETEMKCKTIGDILANSK